MKATQEGGESSVHPSPHPRRPSGGLRQSHGAPGSLASDLGRAGFTLIELIIALVVFGVAVGLTLPRIGSWLGHEQEKTATRVLDKLLARTRVEAMLSGREWRLDLDWKTGTCRLSPADTDGNAALLPSGPASPDQSKALVMQNALPTSLRLAAVFTAAGRYDDSRLLSIRLRPEGVCQPCFIRLSDQDGVEMAIVVHAIGCRVESIQENIKQAQDAFRRNHAVLDLPWKEPAAGSSPSIQPLTP